MLYLIAAKRLRPAADRHRRHQRPARRPPAVLDVGPRALTCPPAAIVLDLPEELCRAATQAAPGPRRRPGTVIRRQREPAAPRRWRRWPRGLPPCTLSTPEEVAAATIDAARCPTIAGTRHGPFDVDRRRARLPGGAASNCSIELGYADRAARPAAGWRRVHPDGRRRCSSATWSTAARTRRACCGWSWAWSRPGRGVLRGRQSRDKLLQGLHGHDVTRHARLGGSMAQLDPETAGVPGRERPGSRRSDQSLRARRRPARGRARRPESSATTAAPPGESASCCLYGETTGETDEYGLPVRYPLGGGVPGEGRRGVRPHPGAGRGVGEQHALPRHRLRVRRPADRAAVSRTELVSVPAARVYYAPARPFPVASGPAPASRS